MNSRFDIEYLAGGDAYFGPNYGGAEIMTNVRAGYGVECPNVAKFVTNLRFTLEMENDLMGAILDEGKEPKMAATEWLKAHFDVVGPWIEGVTTFDDSDAAEALSSHLGL